MNFATFKAARINELLNEEWGNVRIPDLMEVYNAAGRPSSVLETGNFRGVSTEFWALHCAKVVGVDPWMYEPARRDLLLRVGHYPHVTLIRGFSPLSVPGEYDLVYLDGDHSYVTVCNEIDYYKGLVRPGGYIGGHDYTEFPTPGDGVRDAVLDKLGPPDHVTSDNSWLKRL